jgi:galactose mutarotase-like enzyme
VTILIDSCGGELMSILGSNGTEYLWQGDERYWKKRAPHLFPVVGRLTGGVCTLDGVKCAMDTHGFFKWREMEVVRSENDSITFRMNSDEETLFQYPRAFEILLTYQLEGYSVVVQFKIKNQDKRVMWFGYGAHPGFRVPLKSDLNFEDYYLEFENSDLLMVGMSKTCFVEGPDRLFKLDGKRLKLKHSLFDNDVIVLKNVGNKIRLATEKDNKSVTVEFSGMPYVGLWHAPKTDAPYVCIEPWTSLPSRQGIIEELGGNPNMIRLDSNCEKKISWRIMLT